MDLRKEKTKAAVRDAFMSLMMKYEYHEITVTELAKEAKIGRKTFYLHYQSTEDVIEDIGNELTRQLRDANEKYFGKTLQDVRNIFEDLNVLIMDYKDMLTRIAQNDSYLLFRQTFEKILENEICDIVLKLQLSSSPNLHYYAEYFSAGIVKLYFEWLKGNTDLTLEKLTRIAQRATLLSADELLS